MERRWYERLGVMKQNEREGEQELNIYARYVSDGKEGITPT